MFSHPLFLSHHQNNISRHQTIVIKLANNNSVDLIKFSISRLEIYKFRLDIYIFKLKIYISNLKIEFPIQPNQLSLSMLSTFLRLYHRNKTENLRRHKKTVYAPKYKLQMSISNPDYPFCNNSITETPCLT